MESWDLKAVRDARYTHTDSHSFNNTPNGSPTFNAPPQMHTLPYIPAQHNHKLVKYTVVHHGDASAY
ncbi:hypothetical protein L249_5030 [Ophiocordyceps polyrhachis-furcata BCC 54312]|uniref:Uncharacterized protein n=1 Tax=Ophiocordyceps polyrhachis-furcata BCC 54312 TaxID=1330021 RepID=A0A367L3H0_9HYPO|nr:hypothetical protein L249_5030 [Ophiocordyceps polyrhachis-furcata BCC 54312]